MKLDGKCKEEFDKWYIKKYYPNAVIITAVVFELNDFYKLHDNKKIGVYEDYFDSVGIEFYIDNDKDDLGMFYFAFIQKKITIVGDTKPEVRTAAIKKVCEIRNEQLNNLK